MDKTTSGIRAIAACSSFGAASGAAAGAVLGGVIAFVEILRFSLPFAGFFWALYLAMLAVPFGIIHGAIIGSTCGSLAGSVGGAIGTPVGWVVAGALGGWDAGYIPSVWISWPIEHILAVVGGAIGAGIGVRLQAGEVDDDRISRLAGAIERSALREWPWWTRLLVAAGLAILGNIAVDQLHQVYSSPLATCGLLLPRR